MPSDLFKIAEMGFPDGESYDFSTFRIKEAAYHELALGYSREVNDQFTFGVKLKPLFGIAGGYTDINQFQLNTSRTSWDMMVDGTIHSSAPIEVEEGTPGEFVVYPRGQGPWDDTVAYRVRAVSERATVDAGALHRLAAPAGDDTAGKAGRKPTGVLAVVDEESETTYLELGTPTLSGSTHHDLPPAEGDLLADRVLVWDAPDPLYGRAFYGQPLDDGVQLSLVEAAYLARASLLTVDGGEEAVVERGREVEGDRFDRRLRAYGALRTAGIVPKTGFKFGADFRTYLDVETVDDLPHSEHLVRVVEGDHRFSPRELSLDVRLAGGVRKEMVFALTAVTDGDPARDADVEWLSIGRLTP